MTREELVTRAEAELGKTNWRPYLNFCGIDFKTDWCVAFVSWAFGDLNGRAIPNKLINVTPTRKWFRDRNRYMDKATYTPKPGDLIIYKWRDDGMVHHVGIVRYTTDTHVHTVEGNVDFVNGISRVGYKKRTLTYDPIDGYCHTIMSDWVDPDPGEPWEPEDPGDNPYLPPDEQSVYYKPKKWKWYLYQKRRG